MTVTSSPSRTRPATPSGTKYGLHVGPVAAASRCGRRRGASMRCLEFVLVFRLAGDLLLAAHAQQRLGQQHQHRIGIDDGREHQAVGVEGVAGHDDLPAGQPARPALERVRVIQAAANAGAARRHHDHRQVVIAGAGPALVAGHFEQIDGVEAVIAELNFGDRPAAGVGDAHGAADDAAFVERRVPGGLADPAWR